MERTELKEIKLTKSIKIWIDCRGEYNESNGEREVKRILKKMRIKFYQEVYLDERYNRRYDFVFLHNGVIHVLEFDGIQHFKFNEYFHKDEHEFIEERGRDIAKSKKVAKLGYKLIRIDYTQLEKGRIKEKIQQGLDSESHFFSDKRRYRHILIALQI